jgi:endonuclease/exonuclease/phosphatase family metal-dependent hydrolase
VLSDADADIIGLQEVDCRSPLPSGETQLERLASLTGLEAVAGPTRQEGEGFFGNALLSRHSMGDVTLIDVSVRGREPRGILHGRFQIGRRSVELFNTHFGLNPRERRRQVQRLLEAADALHDATLVVLGDFNEWRARAAALVRLSAAFGAVPAVRTFPSRFPILALDRVWVRPRPALRDLRAVRTPLARIASDHLPVQALVMLTASSESTRSGFCHP